MQFTSTAREDVNRNVGWPPNFAAPVSVTDTVRPEDPKPWVSSNGYRHEVQAWHPISGSDFYDPRPGYRAPQNPILVAFRGRLRYQSMVNPVSSARLAEVWLSDLPRYGGGEHVGDLPEHIEHARKVLTRLAAVFG